MKNDTSGLEQALRLAAADYPLMLECDAVKLIYQNEFGCGHLIDDADASLSRLRSELESVRHDDRREFEAIGNGFSRLNLAAVKEKLPPEIINSMFVFSAERHGSLDAFRSKLSLLRSLCAAGIFGFSSDALEAYLGEYASKNYPAVSHSETYRSAYSPSYRVVNSSFEPLIDVIAAIFGLINTRNCVTVAFEGMAASGKTTAAKLVGGIFDANVFHSDDFFLPVGLRMPERFAQAGGNIHYERMRAEVTDNLRKNANFSYRVFDCAAMDYSQTVDVSPKQLSIVEGAYSMHPYFGGVYDLGVFFEVSPDEQARRIITRNGPEMYKRFRDSFIPMENKYFEHFNIRSSCAITVRTERDGT